MNQEIRQLALRGEYLPELGKTFCFIMPNGDNGLNKIMANSTDCSWEPYRKQGYVFFPDEQTRTEYLQVGEGTWLPKEGDLFCSCERADPTNIYPNNKSRLATARSNYAVDAYWVYAPSWGQLVSFIAKRKGEEPEPEEIPFTPWNYNPVVPPKPRTIEICISDEAIERTAKTLIKTYQLPDDEDNLSHAKADIVSMVALLHLEATLQNQA